MHFLLPYIRLELLIRTMRTRTWAPEAWPLVKHELLKALAIRRSLARAGWWNWWHRRQASIAAGRLRGLAGAPFGILGRLRDLGGQQVSIAPSVIRSWKRFAEAGAPARAHAIEEYYRASEDDLRRILAGRGDRREDLGAHAGLADTSLIWRSIRRSCARSPAAGHRPRRGR